MTLDPRSIAVQGLTEAEGGTGPGEPYTFGAVTMRHKEQSSVTAVAKQKASVAVRVIPAAVVIPKVYPIAQVTLTHKLAPNG